MCVARDPRRFQARQTKNPTTRIWDRKGLLPELRDRAMSDTISREADIAEKIQIRPVFDTIACYSFAPLTARFLCSLTDAAPTSVSAQKTQPQLEGTIVRCGRLRLNGFPVRVAAFRFTLPQSGRLSQIVTTISQYSAQRTAHSAYDWQDASN